MKYLKVFSLSFGIVFLNTFTFSQSSNWISVDSEFNYEIRCIYADSAQNLLYVGGNFTHIHNIPFHEIAVWNGNNWDSMGSGSSIITPVRGITKFNNQIYSSGIFSSNTNNFIAKWNGNLWDTSGLEINGPCSFYNYNNELYIFGNFDTVNSQYCSSLLKYDGNSIYCYPFSFPQGSNTLISICYYNGEMYLGGSFNINNINNLVRWNGTTLSQVSSGILSGIANVNSFIEYKNELYIAGYFLANAGNPSNHIMRWDGANLTDVGGGADGPIFDMRVFNNELYVVGAFDHIGGIAASRIAKWDGSNWQSLNNDIFDNVILSLSFFNNELYVCGGFTRINSDSIKSIAKYGNPLGINKSKNNEHFILINPNPTKNKFTIKYPINNYHKISLVVTDILGRQLKLYDLTNNSESFTTSLEEFDNGIYLISLINEEFIITTKIIKNE